MCVFHFGGKTKIGEGRTRNPNIVANRRKINISTKFFLIFLSTGSGWHHRVPPIGVTESAVCQKTKKKTKSEKNLFLLIPFCFWQCDHVWYNPLISFVRWLRSENFLIHSSRNKTKKKVSRPLLHSGADHFQIRIAHHPSAFRATPGRASIQTYCLKVDVPQCSLLYSLSLCT